MGIKELTWREHLRGHRLTGREKRPGDSAENCTPVYEVEAFTFQDLVGPWSAFCHFGGFSLLDFYKAANKGAQNKHWCWVTRNRLGCLPSPRTWLSGGGLKSLKYSNGSQLVWFRNAGDGEQIFLMSRQDAQRSYQHIASLFKNHHRGKLFCDCFQAQVLPTEPDMTSEGSDCSVMAAGHRLWRRECWVQCTVSMPFVFQLSE